jgi:hypothetical protein
MTKPPRTAKQAAAALAQCGATAYNAEITTMMKVLTAALREFADKHPEATVELVGEDNPFHGMPSRIRLEGVFDLSDLAQWAISAPYYVEEEV